MKPLYALLTGYLCLSGVAWAQSQPATSPKSSTVTSTTTATSTSSAVRPATPQASTPVAAATPASAASSTNRRQELYDQYHGVSKKSTPARTTTTPVSSPPTRLQTATNTPRPVPISTPVATARPLSPATANGENSNIRIGVRGGLTYPIYFEKITGRDPAPDFVAGVVFQFGKGTLSFQPEINYNRLSTKITGFGIRNLKASADQFIVPLFLKISSGSMTGHRFFVNVGPYASYLSSVSLNGLNQSLDSIDNRFSFGAAAGVGGMIKVGPGHVTVEVRGLYVLGDNAGSTRFGDANLINSEATLGYVFPLGGN
ncbi:PorT family protein [Spirosoma taeanense]|uniref:PorT family protein n=1 Tax=Spirosoma taeanense TaxID=2735870 RepID=A0A6M5Y5X8_9BACT|nr:porin family protein [Spirosoma taeanense]QJW88621.1 PorT family protein [Spirosoma taeanense]